MDLDKIIVGGRNQGLEDEVRPTFNSFGARCRRNRLISSFGRISPWGDACGVGRCHGGLTRSSFAPFNLTLNSTATFDTDGSITVFPPLGSIATANSTVTMTYTIAPIVTTTVNGRSSYQTSTCPGQESFLSPDDQEQCTIVADPARYTLPVIWVPSATAPSTFSSVTSSFNNITSSPGNCASADTTCSPPSRAAANKAQGLSVTTMASTSLNAAQLLSSFLSSIAAATPPSLAAPSSPLYGASGLSVMTSVYEITSTVSTSSYSPIPVFSVYWPSSTTTSGSSTPISTSCVTLKDPHSTICPGEFLDPTGDSSISGGATAISQLISITTNLSNPVEPASATATGTTFSTSPTNTLSDLTSYTATSSPLPSNTASSTPSAEHANGPDHTHRHAIIAVPLTVATLLVFSIIVLLWRRYLPRSFHKVLDSLPCCSFFTRWRKTREKNQQIRRMRILGILTGDNDGFGGSGPIATDTYARHLKKYEDDAARAREKMSFETPTRTPASFYSPGHKRTQSGSLTALPNMGSPWRSPKPRCFSNESREATPLSYSPAGSHGVRAYGPFRRNFNEETGSLASWEEKWFALGSEDGPSSPAVKSATTGSGTEGHGLQKTDVPEALSGPGQSWRKLV